jgi:hypothetical protein
MRTELGDGTSGRHQNLEHIVVRRSRPWHGPMRVCMGCAAGATAHGHALLAAFIQLRLAKVLLSECGSICASASGEAHCAQRRERLRVRVCRACVQACRCASLRTCARLRRCASWRHRRVAGYVCVSKSSRSLSSVFPPNPPKMNTCRSTSTELKEHKQTTTRAGRALLR